MKLSWRGVNLLLLASTAVVFASEGHVTAFTPLQLRQLGLSDVEVGVWSGLLVAVTMSTAVPLGPFWGVLAERYSRRSVILRSFLVLVVALLVAAFAQDLVWLVISRVLLGLSFGMGGVVAATQAMLTPPRHVSQAVATVQVAQPVAASIGPPLGALIIPSLGVPGLYILDAVLILLAGLVLALLLPEPEGGHRPTSVFGRMGEVLGLAWKSEPIRWNLINQFLSRGASGVVDSYLPVRVVQTAADPAVAIGLILGAYGAMTTVATWLVSRIVDRFDVGRLYRLSCLVGAVVAVGLALAPNVWLIGVLACLRAIPTAGSRPLLFAHLARVVPRQHQTGIFGLFPTAGNVGGLILPLAAAGLATGGTAAALLLGAVGHATSALGGTRLNRVR